MLGMDGSVGAYDAKARFSSLLDRVERGEEIVITRHGIAVARLVPASQRRNAAKALRAVEELAKIGDALAARGVVLTVGEVREMREAGRR